MEQQIENTAAANDNAETEDDSYLQEMQQYLKDPVNLNSAGETELSALSLLNPLQVQNLIAYRNLFGKFISIYELQAVPLWDIETIRKLQPFITVSYTENSLASIRSRFKTGDHSILVRISGLLEKPEGYKKDSSTGSSHYLGSAQYLLVRYKYVYKDLLQYGVLAEKDAGEEFFKGSQKQGFDHYSAHLFIRNLGMIKALALGDFTVNLGQGLVAWQSLAFKKGPDVLNIKRQAAVLRPYNSAGEFNFHRGAGITLSKRRWQATAFASYRKIDANLVPDTTLAGDAVSSFQTSGYHRTGGEIADKGAQRQLAFGGNLAYRFKRWHLGINGICYRFSLPVQKEDAPYNKYALSGTFLSNYSVDYSYTYRNMHFFGEAAFTGRLDKAFVNGLLISVAANTDLGIVYRDIGKSYRSLYTNAFTESSSPANEKGLYTGISIRPSASWRIDAYADIYKFPWLRYRTDAPSAGADYFVQLTYKPGKQLELYTSYRSGMRAVNVNPEDLVLPPVILQPKSNWRMDLRFKAGTSVSLGSRVEMVWFDKKGSQAETGFLTFFYVLYKPPVKPFSVHLRLQFAETGGYNSRFYTFENDVLYSFSIPVFYDKAYRYYLNASYEINKRLTCWVRGAQTFYPVKTLIGSGFDEVLGSRKTDIKLQLMYRF